MHKDYPSYNIEKCKSACLDTPGCTALNYRHGSVCNLKDCSATVPVPTSSWNGYEGYYLKIGKWHSNNIIIQNIWWLNLSKVIDLFGA